MIAHQETKLQSKLKVNNSAIEDHQHKIEEREKIIWNLSYATDLKDEIETLIEQKALFEEQKKKMQTEADRLKTVLENFEKDFTSDI